MNLSRIALAGLALGGARIHADGFGEGRLILGDRFLELRTTSSVPNGQMDSRKTRGFDTIIGQHVGTYMDTMETGLLTFRGSWDESCETLGEWGIYSDPSRGARHPMTAALQLGNPELILYNFGFRGPGGRMAEHMEIQLRRMAS